jgi:hypothetical protein
MGVFGIISLSLRTGEAVHEVLPRSLVDRVFYHHSMSGTRSKVVFTSQGPLGMRTHDEEALTPDGLRSEEFAIYATGMAAVFQILLVGENLMDLHDLPLIDIVPETGSFYF